MPPHYIHLILDLNAHIYRTPDAHQLLLYVHVNKTKESPPGGVQAAIEL